MSSLILSYRLRKARELRKPLDLSPNHGLHAEISLLDARLVRRPRRNVLHIPQHILIRPAINKGIEAPHGADAKHRHDIRRAQLLAREVLAARQPLVQQRVAAEEALLEVLDHGRAGLAAGEHERHVARYARLQRAVGVVQPLQVRAVVLVAGRAGQGAGRRGVHGEDVLEDGARLGQLDWRRDFGVAEVGRGAEGVDAL